MELVLRFLLLRNLNKSELSAIRDIGTFLTEKMVERAEGGWKNRSSDERAFHQAFSTIHQNVGESAFRRFDPAEQKFKGGFLVSAFEAVALGIGSDKAIASPLPPSELNEKVKEIWSTSDFTDHIGRGISPARRVPYTIPFGSVHFTAP